LDLTILTVRLKVAVRVKRVGESGRGRSHKLPTGFQRLTF